MELLGRILQLATAWLPLSSHRCIPAPGRNHSIEQLGVGTWEALGPFPIGTRESTLLSSPAYAFLNHSSGQDLDRQFAKLGYDEQETWPSYLSRSGRVGWRRFDSDRDGTTAVFYDDIRWDQIRSTQGWQALQYQSLLRRRFRLDAEKYNGSSQAVLVELLEGQEFKIMPATIGRSESLLDDNLNIWLRGDIYNYGSLFPAQSYRPTKFPKPKTSVFSHRIYLEPGVEYVILVRALYEIRIFGDPGVGSTRGPVIKFKLNAAVDEVAAHAITSNQLQVEPGLHILGDLLDGWHLGDAIGIGLRNPSRSALMEIISVDSVDASHLAMEISPGEGRLYPGQSRTLKIDVHQARPISSKASEFCFDIRYKVDNHAAHGQACFDLVHAAWASRDSSSAYKLVQPYASESVTYAMLIPPTSVNGYHPNESEDLVLALHGAGVPADGRPWTDEMPRRERGWLVVPTGGTEWGMDWHGVSLEAARTSVETARRTIEHIDSRLRDNNTGWSAGNGTALIGHSNGGQGAWHLASRYPDEFTRALPASGYVKIQDYVPYSSWTSTNYMDPALRGLIMSSLSPYDNDLYLSNLAGTPSMVLHGEEDDNVPVWHSKAYAAAANAWSRTKNITRLDVVPKKKHFWPGILQRSEVYHFLQETAPSLSERCARLLHTGFTVSTANPDETGSKCGIRILELDTPGRLGRVEVQARDAGYQAAFRIRTNNVKSFQLRQYLSEFGTVVQVDKDLLELAHDAQPNPLRKENFGWRHFTPSVTARQYGPMIRILSPSRSISIVIPGTSTSKHRSIARNLAHDIFLFYRLDIEILTDQEALQLYARPGYLSGNHIVIGSPLENRMVAALLKESKIPLKWVSRQAFTVHASLFDEAETGIIALVPNHLRPERSLACIIAGVDDTGLEWAARLFPLQTSVPIPEWTVTTSASHARGAGGWAGAGFWADDWSWSEKMSYLM